VNWKPSQWTFYLEDLPSIAVYAVYLVRKEPALREYLVHWRNIKPTLTGNDLKERGLEPGPHFADILRRLRAAWLDGEVVTKDEELALLGKLERG
jgi:tRNA nucleotidyltransferase (CCA-adding enzyme)